jgi:uncharacterized protein YndB with AHSA1/START domain
MSNATATASDSGADSGAASSSAETLTLRRVLPASRDKVFAAWLDPKSLSIFMAPRPGWSATAEVDARVGGKYCINMRVDGRDRPHSGEYLIIDPPKQLSFTWKSHSTNMTPSVVTIDFLEHGAGTELVLTHRNLPVSAVEGHREGWTAILRMLDSF